MARPAEAPFDPSTFPALASASLADLQTALTPILQRKWADQLESLEPLERAKKDVMMAYTIVDLIWVYLKMKGIDPATHEVSAELERVRTYYAKIRAIEEPETRKFKVDVPAAGRFIQHGIPKSQRLGADPAGDQPESSIRGAAAAGRRRAMQEQDAAATAAEQESLGRVGKMGRMRFIAGEEGVERIIPGSGGDIEMDDEDEPRESHDTGGGDPTSEEEEEVETIEPDEARPAMQDGAAMLLDEISADLARAKRKRAEEF